MEKPEIYSTNWHLLTNQQIVDLFDKYLSDVEIQPNMHIVTQLRGLEVAKLQLIEDWNFASLYRIEETGVLYFLTNPSGELFEYDEYEDFENDWKDTTNRVKQFVVLPRTYKLIKINQILAVERLVYPRFKLQLLPNKLENIKVNWIDTQPESPIIFTRLIRKAAEYLNRRKNGH